MVIVCVLQEIRNVAKVQWLQVIADKVKSEQESTEMSVYNIYFCIMY